MLLTSVVMRVTSPAVEYLSMSEYANLWMLEYIASLRFVARPEDEYAPQKPDRMPNRSPAQDIRIMIPPYFQTFPISLALMPFKLYLAGILVHA